MSIYTISDLHLSFLDNKPMRKFGEKWINHAEKIKENWISKVRDEDTIVIPGDFSWAMNLIDTKPDFEYLNNLPGKKILLKGNHDYWWSTLLKMNNFIEENKYKNIYFLYNNSYLVEEKIIVGTRGWNISNIDYNEKIVKRENLRLELSIQDGINKYGKNREIISFMHYPPIIKNIINKYDFINTLKKYNIKKCYYGHLHGNSHKEAIEGTKCNIEFYLVSSDYLNFDLIKI